MIMHLPRLVPAPDRELRRRLDRRGGLGVEGAGRSEPRGGQGQQRFPARGVERRIEKDDVEHALLAREKPEGVGAMRLERIAAEPRRRVEESLDELTPAI